MYPPVDYCFLPLFSLMDWAFSDPPSLVETTCGPKQPYDPVPMKALEGGRDMAQKSDSVDIAKIAQCLLNRLLLIFRIRRLLGTLTFRKSLQCVQQNGLLIAFICCI